MTTEAKVNLKWNCRRPAPAGELTLCSAGFTELATLNKRSRAQAPTSKIVYLNFDGNHVTF